jgi:hypothetical protein
MAEIQTRYVSNTEQQVRQFTLSLVLDDYKCKSENNAD